MAIVESRPGVPLREWQSRQREAARAQRPRDDDDELELNPEAQKRFRILRYCAKTLESARRTRKPHETFDRAWALYKGDVWSPRRAPWRASITINKIRAFITFIQAIMTDNKPRVSVEPLVPGSEDAADLLRKLSDRDWDENDMQLVCSLWVLYGLIWGYAFVKVYYDPYANGGRGKHCTDVIPPYEIFVNPDAKSVEDAEYIIHCKQMSMGWIRRNFPVQARSVDKVKGFKTHDESDKMGDRNRDYVRDGDNKAPRILSAMNIDGNVTYPPSPMTQNRYFDDDRETVEIAEYWLRDDTLEAYQRPIVKGGKMEMQPEVVDGVAVMDVVGTKQIISDIDGTLISVPDRQPKMVPKMETAWRLKFPNGRLIVIAAGKILLRDIPNPYQTDGFPFSMWKDYDVGSVYAQGEPLALQSCATAVNKIASQVYEILQKMGNPGWKIKKGAGVNTNAITGQPGQCVPMEDTQQGMVPLDKPTIPGEFFTLFNIITEGMAEVSGVNNAITGGMKPDNTSFATIDQLQESGSAPIRLKVRNFEAGLKRYGTLRLQLIQQYDQGDRPLRIEEDYPGDVVQPPGEVQVQFRRYTNADLQGQIEFSVQPISSLSTSPAGVWQKWLTMYKDGIIDLQWFHVKRRIEGYRTELPRMIKQKQLEAAQGAALKKVSKVGGTSPAKSAAQSRRGAPSNTPPPG